MSSKLAINDLTFSEDVLGSELQSINGRGGTLGKLVEKATDWIDTNVTPPLEDLVPCAIGAIVAGLPGCVVADYVVNRSGGSNSRSGGSNSRRHLD